VCQLPVPSLAVWMFALELFLRQLNRTTDTLSNKKSCVNLLPFYLHYELDLNLWSVTLWGLGLRLVDPLCFQNACDNHSYLSRLALSD